MAGEELDPSLWGKLPPDLHSLVIKCLPLRSIARLRAVNRSWNRAWYFSVIKNENCKINAKEWEDAAWWQILSRIDDHKIQVRLSSVCRGWNRHCRSLPALKVHVPEFGKRKALEFMRSALRSRIRRKGIRELELRYMGGDTGIPEHHVLGLLQPFRTELEKLDLSLIRNRFFRLWRHIGGRFPRLQKLSVSGSMVGPIPERKTFASLREVNLMLTGIPVTTVKKLIGACPSLERLTVLARIHGLQEEEENISLESESLQTLILSHRLRDHSMAGLEVLMPRLKTLALCNIRLVNCRGCGNLEHLDIPVASDPVSIEQVGKLRSMAFHDSKRGGVEALLRMLRMNPGVRRLRLMTDFVLGQERVRLRQIVPPQLERLYFESNLMMMIDTDGEHWDEVGEEVLLREGRGEDMFALKRVAFDLRDVVWSEMVERKLVSILAQMLRCSPQLEHIALFYQWDFGERQWLDGALWSFRAADDRLVVSWSGPGAEFFDDRCFSLVAKLMLGR